MVMRIPACATVFTSVVSLLAVLSKAFPQECPLASDGHKCLPEDFFSDPSAGASLIQRRAVKPLGLEGPAGASPEPAVALAAMREQLSKKQGRSFGEEIILKALELPATPTLADALSFCNKAALDEEVPIVYFELIGVPVFRQTADSLATLKAVDEIKSSESKDLTAQLKEIKNLLLGSIKSAFQSLKDRLLLPSTLLGVGRTKSALCNEGLYKCLKQWDKVKAQLSDTFTEAQFGAICMYTTNAFYADLNTGLRLEEAARARKYVKYLRLFIESMTMLEAVQVTEVGRGMSIDLCGEQDGETVYKVQTKGSKNILVGLDGEFDDWQVISTTTDGKIAVDFTSPFREKQRGTLVSYKPLRVRNVEDFSVYENEKERIFLPGAKFKVVRIEKSPENTGSIACYVTLEQVSEFFGYSSYFQTAPTGLGL